MTRQECLEAVWDWVSRSHATFPEHDHHCIGDRVPNACTCGYTAATEAMNALNVMDAATAK